MPVLRSSRKGGRPKRTRPESPSLDEQQPGTSTGGPTGAGMGFAEMLQALQALVMAAPARGAGQAEDVSDVESEDWEQKPTSQLHSRQIPDSRHQAREEERRSAQACSSFRLNQPYTGGVGQDLEQWLAAFNNQALRVRASNRDKLIILPTYLSGRALDWHTKRVAMCPFESFDELIHELKVKFTLTEAQITTRQSALQAMRWTPRELLTTYNERFVAAAERTELTEKMLKDVYLRSLGPQLSTQVLTQRPTSLESAMEQAEYLESSIRCLGGTGTHLAQVAADQPSSPAPRMEAWMERVEGQLSAIQAQVPAAKVTPGGNNSFRPPPCKKCGNTNHRTELCGVRCSSCGRMGHRERECRSNPQPTPSANPVPTDATCGHCGRKGHAREKCFHNPQSPRYRPQGQINPNKGRRDEAQKSPNA